MNIAQLFDKIVVKENGCMEWIGGYNAWGYGQVWFNGREEVVHILMYEFFEGPVPKGLVLDHFKCDNTKCCRISHVKPVTVKENVLRGNGITAMKARQTECIKGHSLSGSNLYVRPDGHRACKICRRECLRRYRSNCAKSWECE